MFIDMKKRMRQERKNKRKRERERRGEVALFGNEPRDSQKQGSYKFLFPLWFFLIIYQRLAIGINSSKEKKKKDRLPQPDTPIMIKMTIEQ